MDTRDRQEDEHVCPRTNNTGGKNDETDAALLRAHREKAGFFGKHCDSGKKIEGSRKRGRALMTWSDSAKEAADASAQELSRALRTGRRGCHSRHRLPRSKS